jgi:hypothetical protein
MPPHISCLQTIVCENFTTCNTLWTFFSVHELISKTEHQEICLIFSHPSLSYRRRTTTFFYRTACNDVTDKLTTFKLRIDIFTHSKFKMHTVLTSTVSRDSDKMKPQANNLSFNRHTSHFFAPAWESHQQLHHHPYESTWDSFITEYHLQVLVLRLLVFRHLMLHNRY